MRFDEQDYIHSGQLEQYCLGLLDSGEAQEVEKLANQYPAIREELDRLTAALAHYTADNIITPNPDLKNRVMTALSQLGEAPAFDLDRLPLINAFSDADQWQRSVTSIEPPADFRNIFGHILRQDENVEQFLVWVRQSINPEDHHDERESFLILEGCCECSIGGERIQLSAGDYLDVPLDLEHTVRVLSDTPVKAIIQRLKAV